MRGGRKTQESLHRGGGGKNDGAEGWEPSSKTPAHARGGDGEGHEFREVIVILLLVLTTITIFTRIFAEPGCRRAPRLHLALGAESTSRAADVLPAFPCSSPARPEVASGTTAPPRHSRALVIVNTKFCGGEEVLGTRRGAEREAENLSRTLPRLNHQATLAHDKTAEEIVPRQAPAHLPHPPPAHPAPRGAVWSQRVGSSAAASS